MQASPAGITLVISLIIIGLLLFPNIFTIILMIIVLALAASLWQSSLSKLDGLFVNPKTGSEDIEGAIIWLQISI